MNEIAITKSLISEYTSLITDTDRRKIAIQLNSENLIRKLQAEHDWTDSGARALVCLANDYGAFMLRNALALAIALGKEDGDLHF